MIKNLEGRIRAGFAKTLVATLLLSATTYAADITGKIRRLAQSTGPAIQNAMVTLDNQPRILTDTNGNYTLTNVSLGNHTIKYGAQVCRDDVEQVNVTGNMTFNITLADTLQTTAMGTGVYDVNQFKEMFRASFYNPKEYWRFRNYPQRTFISNATTIDRQKFHDWLGAGTGNWQDSPPGSFEYDNKQAIWLFSPDSASIVNTGGVLAKFNAAGNSTNQFNNPADRQYLLLTVSQVTSGVPQTTLLHEVAGWGLGRDYVFSRPSYMNTTGNAYSLTDAVLNQVALRIQGAQLRGEHHGSSLSQTNNVSAVREGTTVPEVFGLYQNHPNPFNPKTTIRFDVSKRSVVILGVYDILGREVRLLENQSFEPGKYRTEFDGTGLSSGVYMLRGTIGGKTQSYRMCLTK